jgi:hypothetical protein
MATGDPWVFQKQREQPSLTVTSPESNIVFNTGNSEILRVAEDGFYIRGVKVPVDDKEALEVYNCFKEWLVWSTLNRQ